MDKMVDKSGHYWLKSRQMLGRGVLKRNEGLTFFFPSVIQTAKTRTTSARRLGGGDWLSGQRRASQTERKKKWSRALRTWRTWRLLHCCCSSISTDVVVHSGVPAVVEGLTVFSSVCRVTLWGSGCPWWRPGWRSTTASRTSCGRTSTRTATTCSRRRSATCAKVAPPSSFQCFMKL